jgi:hypothetical protein
MSDIMLKTADKKFAIYQLRLDIPMSPQFPDVVYCHSTQCPIAQKPPILLTQCKIQATTNLHTFHLDVSLQAVQILQVIATFLMANWYCESLVLLCPLA